MRAQERSALKPDVTVTFAGIMTKAVVSAEFPWTPGGIMTLRVDAKVSAVVSTGTVTLTLQAGNTVTGFTDVKAASEITADGIKTILFNGFIDATDATLAPLAANGRLVLTTTHADDAVTFDTILVTQP